MIPSSFKFTVGRLYIRNDSVRLNSSDLLNSIRWSSLHHCKALSAKINKNYRKCACFSMLGHKFALILGSRFMKTMALALGELPKEGNVTCLWFWQIFLKIRLCGEIPFSTCESLHLIKPSQNSTYQRLSTARIIGSSGLT